MGETDSTFDKFWQSYPRKQDKGTARKAWKKHGSILEGDLFGKIMNSIAAHKRTAQWQREAGRFIPYPASFLNGEMWEDEIEGEAICTECHHSRLLHKEIAKRKSLERYCEALECKCYEVERFV